MRKTNLLVVDDNKSLVEMIKEYFDKHADITVAYDAYDGIEAIRAEYRLR